MVLRWRWWWCKVGGDVMAVVRARLGTLANLPLTFPPAPLGERLDAVMFLLCLKFD